MSIGTLVTHQTPTAREASLPVSFDFSQRHEVVSGQKLTGTPILAVFLNGVASTDLTAASPVIDSTGTLVQFTFTNVSATVGNTYVIGCSVNLSGGAAPIVETLDVFVDGIA